MTKLFNITYILPYDWGGMPHYTAEIVNAMSKYANVSVIGSEQMNENYFDKDVKTYKVFKPLNFSMNNLNNMLLLRNLTNIISFKNLKILNNIKPDIIHITTPLMPPLAFFIKIYSFDKKIPIIYTKHGIYSNSGWFKKIFEEKLVNLAESVTNFKKIIVHTEKDKNDLIENKKCDPLRLNVIPHGIYDFFTKNNADVEEENSILFFGNIRKYKGLWYLIEAMQYIQYEMGDDVKVIIAGEGDMSEYDDIIKFNKQYEIHNYFIPDYEVPNFFKRCKVVVIPYTVMSGQSGIINIAYAFDKPVVASDVGGIKEVLKHGETGYLVPPKNAYLLAEAIMKILKEDKKRKEMKKNIKEMKSNLSWDRIAKMHLKVYKNCKKGEK